MIAVDTNILIYAHRADSAFYTAARACMTRLLISRAQWALPWPCLHEFFSITTHPRIYKPASTPAMAMEQIDAWLESPGVVLMAESPAHWHTLKALLMRAKLAGPAVHDARIAALCLQHGVSEFWSADRDFNRFPSLKVVNPLVG